MIKIIIFILLVFPVFINASNVNYDTAKDKVNNYIRLSNFSDRKKYINLDESIPYIYENGNLVQSNTFYRGGMLSKTEYELSQTNGSSYLTLGLKFWTLTPGNGGKQYYVENYLDQREKNEPAAVRSTIFAKSNVYVVGKGTYSIPWEFRIFHTVRIMPKANGRVECAEENCTVVNTTAIRDKVTSGSDVTFRILPNCGYKYLANDQCNLKNTSGSTYKINNVTSDIRCVVEFYPRTYVLKLSPGSGVEYRRNPSLNKIYYKYEVGIYSDSDASDRFNRITPPTRIGYQFRGYYYGDTQVIDEYGNLIESQRKQITDFNCNGTEIQELIAHWEPNKIYITYDPDGGTDQNPAKHQIPVTVTRLYDGTDYSGTDGLPNYACTGNCWWNLAKSGYHGTAFWLVDSKTSSAPKVNVNTPFAKNQDMFTGTQKESFENNYETIVTFYAEWIECGVGTYMGDSNSGTSCIGCPAGTFQPNDGQNGCIECAVGSYSSESGSKKCTSCQPLGEDGKKGTTTSTGQTSCNASCGKQYVSEWKNQVWQNNYTNPICKINKCVDGYHKVVNGSVETCEPNRLEITYNAAGGIDLKKVNSIPKTVTLYYNGTTYSSDSGLPNYACSGDCYWRLAYSGYHGTSNWLVGSATSNTKVNANTPFATNQDLANALGKLNEFKTQEVTTVNLYAEWVECAKGTYSDETISDTKCANCNAGTFAASKRSSSCTPCAIGSTSEENASGCTACQPSGATGTGGTTSSTGSITCSSCNKTNVATWENQTWTNNITSPLCSPATCASGYEVNSESCVPKTYTITLNKNGATNNPTSTVSVTYNSSSLSPTSITVPTKSYTVTYDKNSSGATSGADSDTVSYTFDGWTTTQNGSTYLLTKNASVALNSDVSGFTNSSGKWTKTDGTTVYAHWSGTGKVTLPTLTKPNNSCKWYTNKEGTTGATNPGTSVTITGNTTYYAKCVSNNFVGTASNEIQTGSCAGTCHRILFSQITSVSCTNKDNGTTECTFNTKTWKTGGYNAWANYMDLRIYSGNTIVGSVSDCEIKPDTNDYGQAFDPWYSSCKASFTTPSSQVTYTYKAIVSNHGCIKDGYYANFGWGNCNEMTGTIHN